MEQIELGFDPEKAKAGLEELQKSFAQTAISADKALGRDANESIVKLEQAAEKGTNNVKKFFESMAKKVKEDMKTAFNVTGILEGAKFVNEMNSGIRSTLEMERAFSRLQVRLGLTNQQFATLKTNMGARIAGTGQSLESVLPGVDAAASRGGIKDPGQLSAIAESLGRAKGITGEDTGEISESVVEILKAQGKKIDGASFQQTLDALEGTRNAGAFKTAAEAGRSVEGMAPYAQRLGLDTRSMGGLAAAASRSGSSGQDILQKLMAGGTGYDKGAMVNAALGVSLFKNGKMDASAFKDVKQDRFGQYSQKVMEDISGLTGANGGDLKRFLDSMKDGVDSYKQVISGTNETAAQFGIASDNLGTKLDKFKERMKNATREIADGVSDAANAALNGDLGGAGRNLGKAAKGAWDNKGTLAAGGAATLAATLLMGGGLNALFKKVPGLAAGAAEGAIAKQAGATPVYVVNYAEFGAGGLPGGGTPGPGMLSYLPHVLAATTGVYAGSKASDWMKSHENSPLSIGVDYAMKPVVAPMAAILSALTNPRIVKMNPALHADTNHTQMKDQIVQGIIEAHENVAHKLAPPLTNPTAPHPLQGGRR